MKDQGAYTQLAHFKTPVGVQAYKHPETDWWHTLLRQMETKQGTDQFMNTCEYATGTMTSHTYQAACLMAGILVN